MSDTINAWIEQQLKEHLNASFVAVGGDGYHVEVTVVSEQFEGLRAVKKQQLVYAALNEKIADGSIHALIMKTLTPAEWQAQN